MLVTDTTITAMANTGNKYRKTLQDSIYRLLKKNEKLRAEYKTTGNEDIRRMIARNQSLILDFKYQLYDDERRQD